MRTLQVIASRTLGGAEGFFRRLCVGLGERGCEVHAVLRQGAALSPALSAAIPRSELPLRTVWDPLSRHELRHEIQRHRPHLVQTWMSRATRLARVPRGVVHVARLGGFYKPAGFDHADALVVNSRALADHLLAADLPAKRVHLIGNFVDAPRACTADELAGLRAALPLPADAWLLLAAGRCVPVKAWDVLLAALSQLPAQIGGRPLALVLLGDGPLRPALQQQAQRHGLAGRVHFAGWQDDPAPYYALADLVVFPSRPAEALGNVILETWAHGRALVTTANCGARELVRSGEDALQVPCEDAAALGRGIATALGDDALRAGLARGGRLRAERDFDRASVVGAYLDLYRQLLGREAMPEHGVSILMYHQVGEFAPMREHRSTYCDHRRFAAQMAWLHRLRYRVLRLDEALAGLRGERPLPPRAVVLTFDDGYENFYEYALPVLARFGFSAIVYTLADRLGQPSAWFAADGRATPPLMSASRLRELRQIGIDIGSHGLTHQRLAEIDRKTAGTEVADSKDRLQQLLGEPIDHFCYPYGSHDDAVVDMVSAAGYRSAVTCDRASAFADADPLRLPRKAISFGDSLAGYAWKLHMKTRPRVDA